jgi:hypothetical protein
MMLTRLRHFCPLLPLLALGLLLPAGAARADKASNARHAEAKRRVIADSNELVYQAGQGGREPQSVDLMDEEEVQILRSINATRGTWQNYLGYTTVEMKVPLLRPGFTITLPPPSKRTRAKEEAAKKRGLPISEARAESTP